MRYQTELMRAILTNEKAQEIIDYVSPIYGRSYVALWLFQAIGTVLGEVCEIADQLRYETNPATADLLLDLWERQYGISTDSTMTKAQRRNRIIGKTQSRGPCNPAKLAAAVSAAYGGIQVEIKENVAKNTFLVKILDGVTSINPAVAVLERMKPAHLIYEIESAEYHVTETELKIAIAMTRAETYNVDVYNGEQVIVTASVENGVLYLRDYHTSQITSKAEDNVLYIRDDGTSHVTAKIENEILYLNEEVME